MNRQILLLNLALVVWIGGALVRFEQSWSDFEARHRVDSLWPAAEAAPSPLAPGGMERASGDWTQAAMHNPFSFDRNDIPVVAEAPLRETATPSPQAVQPAPVLFGTISLGDDQVAMLGPAGDAGRGYRPVRIGENIGDWELVEIQPKSVVVARGDGARRTIFMNDPTAQIPRDHSRTAPATAVAPAPANVVAPAAPPAPPTPAAAAGGRNGGAAAPQAEGEPRTRVVQTPFGPRVIVEPQ